ncbi:MAG: DNA alkylation repair protein [Syntrophus sp. (in: bacteria)]|nr:DNA alkylation repair protein [Syntrophus sp. (in: bacteria)]
MIYKQIIKRLESMANPVNVAGMARFGINPHNTLGISVTDLRKIAKEVGKDHGLAQQLWRSGIHEARILATLVDVPQMVTEAQMEEWVKDFDSWDVCDSCCMNLFRKTDYAYNKACEWGEREEEFIKRAGFALMATLAVHDKKADDGVFQSLLSIIEREAGDERNYVKKAVNWALRQIGKRNRRCNSLAVEAAERIEKAGLKSGRWIARDALRELRDRKVLGRLKG